MTSRFLRAELQQSKPLEVPHHLYMNFLHPVVATILWYSERDGLDVVSFSHTLLLETWN